MTVATEERRIEPTPEALRYGRVPNPVCPVHGVTMLVGSTLRTVQYLYCPVPECRESCCRQRRIVAG